MVDISGLDKAIVLAALYNNSKRVEYPYKASCPELLTLEQARAFLQSDAKFSDNVWQIDTYYDRDLSVDLTGDAFDSEAYNQANGDGLAERIVEALRLTGTAQDIGWRVTYPPRDPAPLYTVERRRQWRL
jgi:hypothetical protein